LARGLAAHLLMAESTHVLAHVTSHFHYKMVTTYKLSAHLIILLLIQLLLVKLSHSVLQKVADGLLGLLLLMMFRRLKRV
jgi:hypothetical protein